MHEAIQTIVEGDRGCGTRDLGGVYLTGSGESWPCDLIPIALHLCPTCGHGIQPSRAWTWVDGSKLLDVDLGACEAVGRCSKCPIGSVVRSMGRAGLIWIGVKYYPTPEDFTLEARVMGVSRKIPRNSIPVDFKLGETWIILAHRYAIRERLAMGADNGHLGKPDEGTPGAFWIWRPTRLEVVVDGTETDEEIDRYVKRGLTPIIIQRPATAQALVFSANGGK